MSSSVRPGNLIVVTAPSGAGKTTLCHRVIDGLGGSLRFSVSHTTRPPRGRETEGFDYHFVSRKEFDDMVAAGGLIEWAEIHGNAYGTSHGTVEKALSEGVDLFLDIEGQGALQIKERFPRAVLVFILPPKQETLRERLVRRGTDDAEQIERRLAHAQAEIEFLPHYDYVIINDELEDAIAALEHVVLATRQRRENMQHEIAGHTTST
jgi:guanylate kinase